MVPLLHDFALMHYDYIINSPDGGKSVGHDNGSPSFHQLAQGVLN